MIIEKIEILCIQNGTTLTALCKEITGSSGNLPTWKKDKIRPDWLREICLKFNISSDYLLDLPTFNTKISGLTQDEQNALSRFRRLNPDYQIKAQSCMIDLFEMQEKITERTGEYIPSSNNYISVAADEPFKKTGTTNSVK